jgi:RimJ/RimL family protein N-acetyltransferase
MSYPRLKSARLSLDPLLVEHLEPVWALWTEPAVRRYLWDDQVITRSQAAVPLQVSEQDFRERRFGLWGLYAPATTNLIGFCGLRRADVVPEPELLFGLSEFHWGRGLATEAARAVLHYAFSELGLEAVGAATDVPNARSIRVLDRLGISKVRRAEHHGLDTLFYRLTADNWLAAPEAPRGA